MKSGRWTIKSALSLSVVLIRYWTASITLLDTGYFSINPNDIGKESLDEYGKDKFASEMYLKGKYRTNGFPAKVILPGQISGPGWTIINSWGNTSFRVIQDIIDKI